METKKKIRHANIELLRIVALFMIIMYHIVRHCIRVQLVSPEDLEREAVEVFNQPVFYPRLLILNVIMTFGSIGNALFILVSGYFMANREPDTIQIGKISKKLLYQLLFAAILLTCLSPWLHHLRPDIFSGLQRFMRINERFWFVGYYFVVILFGKLFLNKFLKQLEYKQYASFLLVFLALITFSWTNHIMRSFATGLEVFLTGVFLYSFAGFVRRFDVLSRVRTYVLFLLPMLVYALVLISGYNTVVTRIQTYIKSESTEVFLQRIPNFNNSSLVVIIVAICIFELFRRLSLPDSRLIAFLGQSTFMVYLVHDNRFYYELWNLRDWVTTLAASPTIFIIQLIKWTMYTFATGVFAYILYVLLHFILRRNKWLLLRSEKNNINKL